LETATRAQPARNSQRTLVVSGSRPSYRRANSHDLGQVLANVILADSMAGDLSEMQDNSIAEHSYAEFLAKPDHHVTAITVHFADIRARIDDFKRNGLNVPAAQEILEKFEGTLEMLQRQRDTIARLGCSSGLLNAESGKSLLGTELA